jgi:hypothetical protein
MNMPESSNPIDDGQAGNSYRVLRHPTGRIYDN